MTNAHGIPNFSAPAPAPVACPLPVRVSEALAPVASEPAPISQEVARQLVHHVRMLSRMIEAQCCGKRGRISLVSEEGLVLYSTDFDEIDALLARAEGSMTLSLPAPIKPQGKGCQLSDARQERSAQPGCA